MGGEDVPGERSSDPGDLPPLTPVALNVLLALADGERHGYGIMLEVRERTGGRVRLGPGTLYGGIKRPKGGGGIEEAGERAEPGEAPAERGRHYPLTGFWGEGLGAGGQRTGGRVRLGPGTLYGAIKRLKEGGVIEESGQRSEPGEAPDERRRYYRLTGFGGEVLAAEVERLDGLVRAARRKGAFPAPNPEGA